MAWARCATSNRAVTAASMRGHGADVSIVVYPGAFHYFDVEGQARTFLSNVVKDDATGAIGATVAYDPAADADAHRRVSDFFGYHLRRQLSMAPARIDGASPARAEGGERWVRGAPFIDGSSSG